MAYDEKLEARVRSLFASHPEVEIKRMFGGVCFMVSKHMCCGISGDKLMARVGPDQYADCLSEKHVREMDITGKSLRGMVFVEAEGVTRNPDLKKWIDRCMRFVESLPAKK